LRRQEILFHPNATGPSQPCAFGGETRRDGGCCGRPGRALRTVKQAERHQALPNAQSEIRAVCVQDENVG